MAPSPMPAVVQLVNVGGAVGVGGKVRQVALVVLSEELCAGQLLGVPDNLMVVGVAPGVAPGAGLVAPSAVAVYGISVMRFRGSRLGYSEFNTGMWVGSDVLSSPPRRYRVSRCVLSLILCFLTLHMQLQRTFLAILFLAPLRYQVQCRRLPRVFIV